MGLLTLIIITFLFLALLFGLMLLNPFIRQKGDHAKKEQSFGTLWRRSKK
jgi:hypothetical protein